MVQQNKNQNDDFFTLLAQDNAEGKNLPKSEPDIVDPFLVDEIIFKDESGQLKTLKSGQIKSLEETIAAPVALKPLPTKSVLAKAEPLNLDQEIERIVTQANINFSDSALAGRFKNIIQSRLKGVRDQIQTREALLSSTLIGGLSLTEQQVDQVLKIINEESQNLDDKMRQSVSREPFAELKEEVNQLLQEPESTSPPGLVFSQDVPAKTAPVENLVVAKPAASPVISAVKPVSRPVVRTETEFSDQRPKIEDVKFRPRLLGPVGEIRSLTLSDFRRLSPNAEQAAENILAKIKLLEQDSFSDLVAGVNAWKQSDVNQLYLAIGHQSLAETIPVTQVITKRESQKQPTLTNEEFEAIADLNQKLRY